MFHFGEYRFCVAHTLELNELARGLVLRSDGNARVNKENEDDPSSMYMVAIHRSGTVMGVLQAVLNSPFHPLPILRWVSQGHGGRHPLRGVEIRRLVLHPGFDLEDSLKMCFQGSSAPVPVREAVTIAAGLVDVLAEVGNVLKISDFYHFAEERTVTLFARNKFPFTPAGPSVSVNGVVRTPLWGRAADVLPYFRSCRHKLVRSGVFLEPRETRDDHSRWIEDVPGGLFELGRSLS